MLEDQLPLLRRLPTLNRVVFSDYEQPCAVSQKFDEAEMDLRAERFCVTSYDQRRRDALDYSLDRTQRGLAALSLADMLGRSARRNQSLHFTRLSLKD